MTILGSKLLKARGGILYLVRDEFITAEGPPVVSPHTMEPGPGTWTVVDSASVASISGDKIIMPRTANYDPNILSSQFAAGIGTAGKWAIRMTAASAAGVVGFMTSPDFAGYGDGRVLFFAGSLFMNGGAPVIGSASINTDYRAVAVCRSTGGFVFISGGAYGVGWTLLWCSNTAATPNPYRFGAFTFNVTGVMNIDYIRVAQLGGPWATDTGIATNYTAVPVVPLASSSEADFVQFVNWTAGAGETFELSVRRTDADNRWIVRCNQAGGTVKLIERVAGGETERGSAAQVFTVGVAYRISVIAYGDTINTYVNTAAKNSYAAAAFNNTATGCYVDGAAALTEWEIYPRVLSGIAHDMLEAM